MTSHLYAECYDALALESYQQLEPHIHEALTDWAAKQNTSNDNTGATDPHKPPTAIDLGAGTGLSTHTLATACPTAHITACEPDSPLRAALMTRLICHNHRNLVTIRNWTARDLTQNHHGSVDILIALNMVFHLDHNERSSLFTWLHKHLTPRGIAIFAPITSPPASPSGPRTSQSPETYAETTIGKLTYEGLIELSPNGDGSSTNTLHWRIREDQTILAQNQRTTTTYSANTIELTKLADQHQLTATHTPNGLLTIQHA